MQEKQNDLTNHYNLFSHQPPAFVKTKRAPHPQKTEIKIVFQHPNLLYLSNKRVKSKQEISEQIENRLLHLIKNKRQSKTELKKNVRPATSYFSYVQNSTDIESKDEPLRCMTSAQWGGAKQRRRKMDLQSSSLNQHFQQGILSVRRQGCLEQNKNQQRDKIFIKSSFKKQRFGSQPKLNMYLEMQRRIFNYKNRTKKSNLKKQRNKTQQYF